MILSDSENKAAYDFAMAHYERRCTSAAAVRIIAQQTGIGYGITVECPNCGERKNITDYENW